MDQDVIQSRSQIEVITTAFITAANVSRDYRIYGFKCGNGTTRGNDHVSVSVQLQLKSGKNPGTGPRGIGIRGSESPYWPAKVK